MNDEKTTQEMPAAAPVSTLPAIPRARSLGQIGYEAYAATTGGKTFDGRDMPLWSALPERIVNAWEGAALAIVEERVMKSAAVVESGPQQG